jgi:hypothetical protein
MAGIQDLGGCDEFILALLYIIWCVGYQFLLILGFIYQVLFYSSS